MAKRGKTPSLIGGGAGACKFVAAKNKRSCRRCDCKIPRGNHCLEVAIPATQGYKNYCFDCFREILGQTQQDLDNLTAQMQALAG
jgi:hypothetical protein